ncbi:MAG: DUF2459 domain-containing protein [Planctomycetota bacterium]|nr:DUF2459 domain-containing protein [Planctomycetota bacterium]
MLGSQNRKWSLWGWGTMAVGILQVFRCFLRKPLRSALILCGALLLLNAFVLLIGLIPVNRSFQPAEQGIEIFVYSDAAHSEYILPAIHPVRNWKACFSGEFDSESLARSHVAIGWGDERFFIETPSWREMRLGTVLPAIFWPTKSAIKVSFFESPLPHEDLRRVRISEQQYARLVAYIDRGLVNGEDPDAELRCIPGASHGPSSRFFEANGSYHFFWNCNAWIGRGLQEAGVKVGLYTPLPKTVFWGIETGG